MGRRFAVNGDDEGRATQIEEREVDLASAIVDLMEEVREALSRFSEGEEMSISQPLWGFEMRGKPTCVENSLDEDEEEREMGGIKPVISRELRLNKLTLSKRGEMIMLSPRVMLSGLYGRENDSSHFSLVLSIVNFNFNEHY